MSLKERIQQALYFPPVKRRLEKLPLVHNLYPGWLRTHPFDKEHGTDTSGYVASADLQSDPALIPLINPYVGSQPSAVRKALETLPDISDYAFVDLGCGKGRAALVGSEFPFREVIGIEISPALAGIARSNGAKIMRKFPDRPPISIIEGNAVEVPLPKGKIVLFMYHAFGPELMSLLIERLEMLLGTELQHLFILYYNPFFGHLLDASPAFSRWYAGMVPHDPSERGYGPPDRNDAVVIWQSAENAMATPHWLPGRPIFITKDLLRAEVEEQA